MQSVAELIFFRLAPDAPKPYRREEGDVKDGNDGHGHEVEQEREPGVQRSGDRTDHHYEQEARVADADGAQTRPLHRWTSAGRQPERDDWLEDAEGPDGDDRHQHQRLKW